MGINVLKGYGRHDNIEAQNCSFVTVLAKVWIIISFKVETWSQYNEERLGEDQTKGRTEVGMGK